MTEEEKIQYYMKRHAVDRENAMLIMTLHEGFTDEDGVKFNYNEEEGCFISADGKLKAHI